ncbi:MAG: hypothetical protein ACJ767_09920 [Chloroflexota bacterium]
MAEAGAAGRGRGARWAFPFHPFIVGIWSVVLLYGRNTGELDPVDSLLPLAWALLLATVTLAAAFAALRDIRRAGLLATMLLLLFLSFGRVLDEIDSPLVTSGRLLVVWTILGVVAVVAAWRIRRDLRRPTARLNAVALLLVGISLVPAVAGELGGARGGTTATATQAADPDASPGEGEGTAGPDRDIYVIVVEDIGSERTLRDVWGMTGESPFAFLDELRFERIADSHSNYGKTGHSLASMFSLDYLDDLAARMGPDSGDYGPVYDLIDDAAAARFLKDRGYEYVHIGSWWDPTAESSIADVNLGLETPSDFATAWLDTTMLPAITSRLAKLGIHVGVAGLEPHELQYQSALVGFDALHSTLGRPGRTFVFAHVLVPHDPYVFATDGSFVTDDAAADRSREQLFLDQSRYTMGRVESFVREALAGPDESDPIVVVTTDEGPNPLAYEQDDDAFDWQAASDADLREKFEIELGLYLPGVQAATAGGGPHDRMSLVNVFRALFDAYFGMSYGQLPDRSYVYRDKAHPYDITEVTDRLP